MSDFQTCKTCGSPFPAGERICPTCKTPVGGMSLPHLTKAGMDLPGLKFDLPGSKTTFNLPAFDKFGGLPQADLSKLGLNLAAARMSQGRPYRPLFAIGQVEEGQPALRMPFALSLRADGSFVVMNYVDESGCARVQAFDAQGSPVGAAIDFASGGQADAFDTPGSLAVDGRNNLFIADLTRNCIKKISAEGQALATLGKEGSAANELSSPRGLAMDGQDCLLIADSGNNRVLKWDGQGACLLAVGTNEVEEDTGWVMPGGDPGQLDGPLSVAADAQNNIYVADTNNHRIQKFDAQGRLVLAFGEEGQAAGEFSYPSTLRLDEKGYLYVVDQGQERIQRFDPGGNFVYQILMPEGTGAIEDFVVDREGRLLVAMRKANLVLALEVQ